MFDNANSNYFDAASFQLHTTSKTLTMTIITQHLIFTDTQRLIRLIEPA